MIEYIYIYFQLIIDFLLVLSQYLHFAHCMCMPCIPLWTQLRHTAFRQQLGTLQFFSKLELDFQESKLQDLSYGHTVDLFGLSIGGPKVRTPAKACIQS